MNPATALHIQTENPAALPGRELPGLLEHRIMTRVGDYLYAAPGMSTVLMAEFGSEAEAVKAADGLEASGALVNVFRQLSPERGWLTADGVQEGPRRPSGTAVLSVVMDVEHDGLADFHGWYDEEHLPKLAAVPGILCALRYKALTADDAPSTSQPEAGRSRFLAWYEFADESVVASPEFADASVLTPRTAVATARLTWASQLYVDGAR
jgi:hypothetical protein